LGRIDRYILTQLLVVFSLSALILVMVYWINRAVALFDQLIADGQGFGTFLELTALSLPNIIRMVLPISAFAAALWVTNRLSGDSELTVAQATGLGPWRLARPFAAFGLITLVLMLMLTHVLVPLSLSRLNDRQAEIAETATARLLREGQFLTPQPGITFYVRDVSAEGELSDIYLSDRRDPVREVTHTAQRAYLVRTARGPQLVMVAGQVQVMDRTTGQMTVTTFQDFAYDIAALIRQTGPNARSPREVPSWEMLAPAPALLTETGETADELSAVLHDRTAQGLFALTGALVGFGTLLVGGFSRFGVWRQVLAAIGVMIGIKILESGVTTMIRRAPDAWLLTYLPALIGLLLAAGLLAWAAGGLSGRRAKPA
jgi:lipopolysaccharide export system permease protein